MTLQEAKSIARYLGLTLRQVRSGDYRVNFRDGNENGMITQVRFGCGPGRTRVAGVCVARTTIRHTRRAYRRAYRRAVPPTAPAAV